MIPPVVAVASTSFRSHAMDRLRYFVWAALVVVGAGPTAAADRPPNVVILLSDDVGYGELFDLSADLGQVRNLAETYPARVKALTELLERTKKSEGTRPGWSR